MKLIVAAFLVAFSILSIGVKAQQTHYIYIQTSDKQPFYVKLDKNVYSSSVTGYLIISKLIENTYNFSIGFPKSEWPQQNFSCTIDGNDKGFLLKNFGEKGWGLFNMQTLDVTMATAKPVEDKSIEKVERTDSFSNMLSAVVKDPGIRMTVKQPEPKIDTVQPAPVIQKEEPVVVKETVAVETPASSVPVVKPIEAKPKSKASTIIKLLGRADNDGTQLVYLDIYAGHKDTIRIFIPADKPIEKKDVAIVQPPVTEPQPIAQPEPAKAAPKQELQPEPVKKQAKAKDKKFIDMDLPASKPAVDTEVKAPSAPALIVQPATIVGNKDCQAIALEDDFLKLRKKMAAEEKDDDMISVAIKVFKTKCFNTGQIKNLGFLFLNDKGRYSFFNKAYSFVSDPENYGSLENQLTEPYYLTRFKELIHH